MERVSPIFEKLQSWRNTYGFFIIWTIIMGLLLSYVFLNGKQNYYLLPIIIIIGFSIWYMHTTLRKFTSPFPYISYFPYVLLFAMITFVLLTYQYGYKYAQYIDYLLYFAFITIFATTPYKIPAIISIILYTIYLWFGPYFVSHIPIASLFRVNTTLLFFIAIVALAIFYLLYLKSNTPLQTNLFLQIVFYLPCLFIELLEFLLQEYRSTANTVFVLFLMEIIAILGYLYIPYWINRFVNIGRTGLLDGSTSLDTVQTIATNSVFIIPNTTTYRTKYSISCWIYINQRSSNSSGYVGEKSIIDYGTGIAQLTYYNNSDSSVSEQNKCIAYFSNTNKTNTKYEFPLQGQKWNFIVFSFESTDLCNFYVNGELKKTVDISTCMPVYSQSDVLEIGDDNGLDGAICNISYYTVPLHSHEISTLYNTYQFSNPPTNR